MKRVEITFSGEVQGVGFRYASEIVARGFEVGGWVRNEPDGTVSMVVEGSGAAIEGYLAALRGRLSGLRFVDACRDAPATGEFSRMEVRRH